MTTFTAPGPTVRQLSFATEGAFSLCVLAKRTYTAGDDGVCVLAEEQLPLVDSIVTSPEDGNLVVQDFDLFPRKTRTDVIVRGHAHASGQPGIVASVAVHGKRKDILVVGERRATLSAAGGIVISAAEPFERMPVTFARAYGGRDRVAEAKHGYPMAALAPFLVGTHVNASNQSPYLYPRNPCGRGYLVDPTREAVEACELPNLEDPEDLLTPDRLALGHPSRWIHMPLPQAFDWVGEGWFPRLAFAGLWPDYEKSDRPVPEVAKGLLPRAVLEERKPPGPPSFEHAVRFASGAPLDMQFSHLPADETLELTHLHPRKKKWTVRLPGEKPKIWTDGRNGKHTPTDPVIHTLVVEPDIGRITVVWRGSAPALRPYFPHELPEMPLRVEW